MKAKLSAIVITYNEEKNVALCLEGLKFCDEIIVVDSGSSDHTITIAKEFTDQVFVRPFDDFAAQKNFALSKAQFDWVLSIDADERVTEELQEEIMKAVNEPKGRTQYRIPRQTYFLGRRFRFSGTQKDKPVRLFRREWGTFVQPIHETVSASGKRGTLKTELLHYSTATIEEHRDKTERYTEIEARFLLLQGRSSNRFMMRYKSVGVFLYGLIWNLGFMDGWEGFLFAYYSARYTYCKYRKLFELTRIHRVTATGDMPP